MHKKSSMRSIQAKLSLQGYDSHLLISEKKKKRENKVLFQLTPFLRFTETHGTLGNKTYFLKLFSSVRVLVFVRQYSRIVVNKHEPLF